MNSPFFSQAGVLRTLLRAARHLFLVLTITTWLPLPAQDTASSGPDARVDQQEEQPDAEAESPEAIAEGEVILFEGQISRMSSDLAPPLREGQVLSGFFVVNLERGVEDADPSDAAAQYDDVVVDGEFVFDLNHVMTGFGSWREAPSYLVLNEGQPESGEDSRDIYSVTLPMDGEPVGEGQWRPQWFQIWLFGETGRFLDSLKPQLPPESVGSGWFRATYHSAEGEQATVEGPITYIGPEEGEMSPTEKIAQLEAVVADLSARLSAAQAETAAAREQLAAADRRIRGLNETIDLLIEERAALRAELELVLEQHAESDEALTAKIADLEADHAILSEARDALAEINEELARSLAAREDDLRAARATIARFEAAQAVPPGTEVLKEPVPDSPFPFLAPGQMVRGPEESFSRPVAPQPEEAPQPEVPTEDNEADGVTIQPPPAETHADEMGPPVPEPGVTDSSSDANDEIGAAVSSREGSSEAVEESLESTESATESPGFVRRPRKFRRGR